ncbi:hypothetical protein [uncultured Variovorax sp.]|uniref:hypothetical protein n=1 Tax=uncultured Variovorax sp. TaxID=114708 RepID=UPI0025D26B15|nr:hypothetical protein [uncultured Variovorax sp.]
MTVRTDWKFIGTTLLALISLAASIAIPFVAWKTDLNAKSIKMTVVSQAQLTPSVSNVDGLKIFVGNDELLEGFVSTIRLSNDGAKPITTSEYESSIKIDAGDKIKIIKTQVTSRQPENLPILIKTQASAALIEPLLLNPGDEATIIAITTGGAPKWNSSGRIAGVTQIRNEALKTDGQLNTGKVNWGLLLACIAGFLSYCYYATQLVYKRARGYSFPWTASTMLSLALLSSHGVATTLNKIGFNKNGTMENVVLILCLILMICVSLFIRAKLLKNSTKIQPL